MPSATPAQVLTERQRSKQNSRPDRQFYRQPRFVQHVDERFRERLTRLYRARLGTGDEVLDLMSSWVSHLPDDVDLDSVVGHGLNEDELAANERLTDHFVQDLNQTQELPLPDESFDTAVCALSVQYLQSPAKVFAEVARVLQPGGTVIVSFSRWMFEQKAVQGWREASGTGRLDLVKRYLGATGDFNKAEVIREEAEGVSAFLPNAPDPFYAVCAQRRPRRA